MASEAVCNNRAIRSALDNLLRINKITVQPHFSQALDEIVKAGLIGKDILLDMLQTASSGSNPTPDEGVITRPITQADVKVLAARLAEDKNAAQNDEEDTRAYDENIAAEVANGENALQRARQAAAANRPLPQVVHANVPVAAVQAPVLAPIRRAVIPDIAPGEEAEANGAPVADPREEARKVVEDEKIKVLRYQELLLEKRELEEVRYDPELELDYKLYTGSKDSKGSTVSSGSTVSTIIIECHLEKSTGI